MARKRKESSAADRDEAGPRKKQGGAKGSNQREAGLGTDDTPPPHATPPPPPKVATLQQLSKAETEYLRWLTSRGVKLNGVSIGRFPRTGRGCVATRDIAPGEVVIEVPDDEVITADGSVAGNALTAFGICGDALSENPSPRLQREALVLAVMAEMSRGAESTFAAYLNALPRLRATHSPLAWSAEELFELQGTSTMDDMLWTADQELELPSMVADHWKHVAEPFLRENPEFARAPGADEDEDIDMEEAKKMYLHATALVACFSFTLGGDDECGHDHGTTTQAMVPFWDMLNHREPAAASVTLNHDPETGMLQMIAVKPVRAGAEVFNTYGAAGDSELLRRYGFVMRRNPHGGGSTVGVRELMAAAAMARYTADREDEEMRQQGGSLEDDADNNSDDDDDDDFGPPPPFSDSEEEQEDDDDDEEEKEEEEEEEVSDEDEDGEDTNLGLGEISRSDILERLRWLRRQGILSDSQERFSVSRTGRPSLALRYAARVLSMHSFQFKRLLAADAYERGDRADQTGAYSDDEDEDEDTFGGFKPLTVEQVWNGVSGAGGDELEDEEDDEEVEERHDQMSRVAVALVALAENALRQGRFPTKTLAEDYKRLRHLGRERPGERDRAGSGGWRGGLQRDGRSQPEEAAREGGYKRGWRDVERRTTHRTRMALVVRVTEKRALKALSAWASHPCRSEEELLPPLVREEEE